jgi:preprotein translocase subunit SecG
MTGWLIFIAVLLVLIVLFQVTKTLDLVNQLRGDDDSQLEKTSKLQAYALFVFMILGVIGFFWCFTYCYRNRAGVVQYSAFCFCIYVPIQKDQGCNALCP